jgi:hypothetical protein
LLGVMNENVPGKHQYRQYERHQPDPDRGDHVLDGDDLVVLAPDVFREKGLRIVQVRVLVGDRDVGHQTLPPFCMAAPPVSAGY